MALTAWADGTGTCMESLDGANLRADICGPTLPMSQWFHVAGRWTGQKKTLFIDGVQISELPATASPFDANDFVIGGDQNGGRPVYLWRGRIDDLELYDRGLTNQEIEQLRAR